MISDARWKTDNKLSLPMGEFRFLLHFMHSPCMYVSLQIATLVQSMLSAMAAGDASQTTQVQIMHAFMLCYFTQIEHVQF